MIRISAALACCALVSGCVSIDSYPDEWAEMVQVKSGACPDIDGEHKNAAEQFDKTKNGVHERIGRSLAHLLNGGSLYAWHQADNRFGKTIVDPAQDAYQTISLRLVEGKLHIKASLSGGSTKTFDLPTRQRCSDSTLLLEGDWHGTATLLTLSLFLTIVDRVTLALGRAEDGSLLVRETAMGGAFIAWAPIPAYVDSAWTRFPPVVQAPEQLSGLTP